MKNDLQKHGRSGTTASAVLAALIGQAAWLAAALGFALTVGLFWPGFMSPDSADQWLQARTGNYTSAHPPLLALMWSVSERIYSGPGPLFVLHALAFWAALGWLARGLFARPGPQVLMVLALGLWPPVFGTIAHLWKDVPMVALTLLACAVLVVELRRPSRLRLVLAVALLALACAYRHNALPLVLPLLVHVAIRLGAPNWPARLALAGLLAMATWLLAALPARHPDVIARQVWPVTAVWDLAAVSIATGQMLVPADWRTATLDVPTLEAAFRPWSNTTVFDTDQLRISLYQDITPAQSASLRRAWLDAWRAYPRAMLGHRMRLSALLFGIDPDPARAALAMSPGIAALPENPPLALPESRARERVVAVLQRLTNTTIYAGWAYLLVLAVVAASAWRRPVHPLFWPVVASAVLLCLPLPLFAPSAEFRYLIWLVLATGFAIALRLAPTRVLA